MSHHILVVEDEPDMARILEDNLVFEGYTVTIAGSGREALRILDTATIALVLLDLRLPDVDGFDLCRELSKNASAPPIIIVSARSQGEDKVRGFGVGADDYVTKPFDVKELLARIRRTLRRAEPPPPPAAPADPHVAKLRLGAILVDFDRHVATRNREDIGLSERELQILQYFAQRPGKVVTRDELLRDVWGFPQEPSTLRRVDIAIRRLRCKIEFDPANPRYIRTAHGDGYCFTPD
jgi:two-component system, OmpR family, response regulator VicR